MQYFWLCGIIYVFDTRVLIQWAETSQVCGHVAAQQVLNHCAGEAVRNG